MSIEFRRFDPYTDELANKKDQRIMIQHVLTGRIVIFKAFLTSYRDNFSSNWEEEDVYGRMDPIATFTRTRRTITIGWDCPSANFDESRRNLQEASALMQFLYPSYSEIGENAIIDGSPLLRLKFMNWSQNVATQQDVRSGRRDRAAAVSDMVNGLLGYTEGFDFAPDLEAGAFDPMPQTDGETTEEALQDDPIGQVISNNYFEVFPKVLKFECTFKVLHEHPLGWNKDRKPRGAFEKFPYFQNRSDVARGDPLTQALFEGGERTTVNDRAVQKASQDILKNFDSTTLA